MILLIATCCSMLIWVFSQNNILSLIGFIPFVYLIWHVSYREKSSYKIYEDRIDFFNERDPSKKELIRNEDIFQVRYEDEFGKGYDTSQWQIFIYLRKQHQSDCKKIKGNRIKIAIKNKDRVNRIISILKFYQSQKKEIYILTKYKQINKELGLKNWNNP